MAKKFSGKVFSLVLKSFYSFLEGFMGFLVKEKKTFGFLRFVKKFQVEEYQSWAEFELKKAISHAPQPLNRKLLQFNIKLQLKSTQNRSNNPNKLHSINQLKTLINFQLAEVQYISYKTKKSINLWFVNSTTPKSN